MRDHLGTAAKRELEERFSWEAIAERTIDCYRDVLEL
jgi:glycosyltransferase involved in cell wall biosynthesis